MAEERDDPVPTDDPRQTETSDQNAEESPPGRGARLGRARRQRPLARRAEHVARAGGRRRAGDRQPRRPAGGRSSSHIAGPALCVRVGPTRPGGVALPAMRKEAALIGVLGVLGWCAAPASAAPNVLAQWTLDEGIGQVAGDASGHANTGQLGAHGRPRRRRSRLDPRPRRRRRAGLQRLVLRDGARHRPARAPAARRRRMGAARRLARASWRYVLSKGSLQCDRSAYGLYSGWSGGMAFYVSSPSEYTISPEVSVRDRVGRRVAPRHRLLRRRPRAAVDRRLQVGAGTPASMAIAYTTGSRGVYIGTYRGSCDLGFSGAIDDVAVWDDRPPAATTGPVIAPRARHADAHRHRRRREQHRHRRPGARCDQEPAPRLPARDAQPPARSRCAARRG